VASEPITVTDSDVQSLEKKLLQFAEGLPDAEQMYLAAMLAKGIEDPLEVAGFLGEVRGESQDKGHKEYIEVLSGPTPRIPLENLQGWMRNMGVKV
jgi:hypothetical protein